MAQARRTRSRLLPIPAVETVPSGEIQPIKALMQATVLEPGPLAAGTDDVGGPARLLGCPECLVELETVELRDAVKDLPDELPSLIETIVSAVRDVRIGSQPLLGLIAQLGQD